jgi:D-glycero-D-manno-heptose 1,7-bisphosphate phosphatase
MLQEIERRLNVPLAGVPFVGDSLRDMEAAAAAGARPILVLTGKGRKTRDAGGLPAKTEVFADLAAFAVNLVESRAEQRTA